VSVSRVRDPKNPFLNLIPISNFNSYFLLSSPPSNKFYNL
jgi:hypothetical protein